MRRSVPRGRIAVAGLAALVLVTGSTCGDEDTSIHALASEVTEAEVGDEVVIRLSAEPGLGDAWQVAEEPDPAVVRVVDQTSESEEPDVEGGLWTDIVALEAVGAGTTSVVMHNCFRCDDDGNTPAADAEEAVDLTFTITVR